MATPYNPYQQQPQPGYPQQGYAPPPPKRSAIPKVIGILMIIFGSIGIFGGLFGLVSSGANDEMFRNIPELKTFSTVQLVLTLLGTAYGLLELFGGIRAVGYKANAVKLAIAFGITAIVMRLLEAILTYVWMKPIMERAFEHAGGPGAGIASSALGFGVLIGTIFGIAWPTIVLILMTRPAAKAACVNP